MANVSKPQRAVTKHLRLLEAANLVAVVWIGREKLHYLNPVPISEIFARFTEPQAVASGTKIQLWIKSPDLLVDGPCD